jgi:tetratricopeptide (TPR) repeat protein
LAESFQGRVLKADVALQEGRYEDASKGYEDLIRDHRTWDNLARLAHLKATMGDVEDAEELYIESEDEITAKEMRSYAWVELQRGLLDVAHGRYESAWAHYERADKAYSGYWLVAEHMAKLLGAQGKTDEAIALYEKVLACAPRPEFQQALGNLYVTMGEPELAKPWHEQALTAYLESTQCGDVHYLHHLADFYADVREDGAEAVRWARKDLELRPNPSARAALAWGLYRDGQFTEALGVMQQALASDVKDAGMFLRAATIYEAAGQDGGQQLLRRAVELNPHYRDVHIHH